MQPLRHSRKARTSALLLLGATALGLSLTHRVSAQATTGGGSLVSPVKGTLVTPPTSPLVPGSSGPSYGLGGTNMVLVKNWDFGTSGNITNYDDMSREFFYHDQVDNLANGFYGASSAAPDFQNSVNDTDQGHGQPIEYQPFQDALYPLPAVRQFMPSSLMTFLKPTHSATGDSYGYNSIFNISDVGKVDPNNHNDVASGSFMAKWKLPAGGSLLGQDVVWETRVRYKAVPEFWFSLWSNGTSELATHGAEADVVESYGNNDVGSGTNYDGHLWHSNMVPADTDAVDYYSSYGFAYGMKSANYGPDTSNFYDPDAPQYHIWTWVYHKDNSYQMYVDGRLAQSSYLTNNPLNKPTQYFWTGYASVPIPSAITDLNGNGFTGVHPAGAPTDMEFKFDASWGNNQGDPNDPNQVKYGLLAQTGVPIDPSILTSANYEFSYSRVYLSAGTGAEGAFPANPKAFGSPLAIPVPNIIPASDYDTGADGSGYHLYAGPVASSSLYRADNNGNIVLASSPDANNDKYMVTNNAPHDWYKYTVSVPQTKNETAAVITASFQVQSTTSGGAFHLEDEQGNVLTGSIVIPGSGSGWQTVTAPYAFSLSTGPNSGDGIHTLRLVMDTVGAGGSVVSFGSMSLAYEALTAPSDTFADSNFSEPVLFGSTNPRYAASSPFSTSYDVRSAYLYNPTGNGWPLAAWTFSGNAGIASNVDEALNVPLNLPGGMKQVAFVQSSNYQSAPTGSGSTLGQTGGILGNISQTLNLQPGKYTLTFNASSSSGYSTYTDPYGYTLKAHPQLQVYVDPVFDSQGILLTGIAEGSPVTPAENNFFSQGNTLPDLYTIPTFTVGSGGITPGIHTVTLAELPFNTTQHGGGNYNSSSNFPDLGIYLANVNLSVVLTASAVPTINNGSFEAPVINNGMTYFYNPDPNLAFSASGWNFVGNCGISANWGKLGNPPTSDGTQMAVLDGGTTSGSINQPVSFPSSGNFTLSFNAAEVYYDPAPHPVQVLVDGNLQGTVLPTMNRLAPVSVTFNVTAGTHTITLQGVSDGTSFRSFVDAVAIAPAAASAVPTINNGSFEAPVINNGMTYFYNPDPNLAFSASGWNFVGNCGISANWGKLGNPPTSDGTQMAVLDGGTTSGSINQPVSFPSSGNFTLSFNAAEVYYDPAPHPVQVLVDGNLQGTVLPTMNRLAPVSVTFNVTAGTHTITLQGVSDGTSFRSFVDAVGLTLAPGPMAGAVFSGPVAAQAAHLAFFDRITASTASAYRALAAAAPANPPSAAFDSNAGTFFDYAQSSGGYVGLSLTAARSVSSIKYAPRAGYETRMVGGVFEGSNTSATAGYTTLATVTATPKDGTGNTLSVTNHTAYKWLRYRGPSSGYCDVAEIQLLH